MAVAAGGPAGHRVEGTAHPEKPLDADSRWETFPYWILILGGIVGYLGYLALFNETYDVDATLSGGGMAGQGSPVTGCAG